MKRAYWFLVLFGIWCVIAALWYLVAVKGIPEDPRYFNPHNNLVAIGEVLIMMLVACLLGYAIGLAIRDEPIEELRNRIEDYDIERKATNERYREQLDVHQSTIHELTNARHDVQRYVAKSESLASQLNTLQHQLNELKTQPPAPVSDELRNESDALRFRVRQLEFQNAEAEENLRKSRHELELYMTLNAKPQVESSHPFVKPAREEEKDDLTVIKGIGPFIEKRLNMVGIYTLQQISEFTPTTIEQVTKAIEFFPNRMVRDNWVGQAKEILMRRL